MPRRKSPEAVKRYSLVLPEELYEKLRTTAEKHHMTVLDLLKRFIKLGLLMESSPGASLVLRENGKEQKILVL
jgi:hypothetical protein